MKWPRPSSSVSGPWRRTRSSAPPRRRQTGMRSSSLPNACKADAGHQGNKAHCQCDPWPPALGRHDRDGNRGQSRYSAAGIRTSGALCADPSRSTGPGSAAEHRQCENLHRRMHRADIEHLNLDGMHNTIHARDCGRLCNPDHAVFARAIATNRLIVTENADEFRTLACGTGLYPGLIIWHSIARRGPIADAIGNSASHLYWWRGSSGSSRRCCAGHRG